MTDSVFLFFTSIFCITSDNFEDDLPRTDGGFYHQHQQLNGNNTNNNSYQRTDSSRRQAEEVSDIVKFISREQKCLKCC